VVNCNVLLFLGDDTFTTAASKWVLQILQKGISAETDRWYQTEAALVYSAARCVERGIGSLRSAKNLIVKKIAMLDSESMPVLEAALFACALANTDRSSPRLSSFARAILQSQQSDGGWAARVFYYDSPKRVLCWGARELTTGFCLEALARTIRP